MTRQGESGEAREPSAKYAVLRKVARLLDLFTVDAPEWSVGDIAQALGLPLSSTSEMMKVIESEGFLRRVKTGRYRMGWRVVAMHRVLTETSELLDVAGPAMEALVARFNETMHLSVLERGQVVYLRKVQGNRALQIGATGVGFRIVAHATGVGKLLMAHRPWAEVEALLQREGMPALTANTITTPERLREELACIRAQGYAYDLEEGMPELCCVAAPIRDFTGGVVAALSLSLPAYRFPEVRDRYRESLLKTVAELSGELGYVS